MDKKILLVEDDELNAEMVSRRLSRKGFNVILANDGNSAINISQKEIPDLILMDVGLPEIDGVQCAKTIRSLPETSFIPIILLTGQVADEEFRDNAKGCYEEYEIKPINFERLFKKIEKLYSSQDNVT